MDIPVSTIMDKISVYREKYRNDHFHKDNIYKIDEIEEIRANTILMHYLLLGSMRITILDGLTPIIPHAKPGPLPPLSPYSAGIHGWACNMGRVLFGSYRI